MPFEDYKLDPVTFDLVLDENGNILGIEGAERVAQSVRMRLQTQRGEWFADDTVGPDWLGTILGKGPDSIDARADLAEQITAVDGVDRVTSLELTVDPGTRVLTVTFSAITDEGIEIGGTV